MSRELDSAYSAPHAGTLRQLLGAFVGNRNPALGGIISGETQRARKIEPLQQEYSLLANVIAANRAAQTSDIQNQERLAQGKYYAARADVAENPVPKTPEEQYVADLQKQVNPATKKPFTPSEALADMWQKKQDVKPEPQDKGALTDLDINGENHKVLVDTKSGKVMQDLGKSKLPNPNAAAGEHDMEPVMAYDKAGRAHIVPKSEATPQNGYSNIIKASDKDLNDAKTHGVVLNDMQTKLNDVVSSADALDQDAGQRAIISNALSHSEPGMWNDFVKSTAMSGATPKTKEYIQSVLSLKESALGLPKEITGGSRTSEIQGNALFQTLPSGASVDSKYALGQAKKFQSNIDRLRQRVPAVRGMEETSPHPALSGNPATGAAAAGKPTHIWTPQGLQAAP